MAKKFKHKSILMIMHATSWSDKREEAKDSIQKLIDDNLYDYVVEFIPSAKHIFERRYINHTGLVYRHDKISPVPFLRDELPSVVKEIKLQNEDKVDLAGGVYNDSEGCLNMLEKYLVELMEKLGLEITINILDDAIYKPF